MKIEDIEVGKVYRGPRREETEYGGIFLFREVTWIDGDTVWFRRPLKFGELFQSKVTTFARWATVNTGDVQAEIAGMA